MDPIFRAKMGSTATPLVPRAGSPFRVFGERPGDEALGDDGELILIDGCPINCAEEIMKKSGFLKYRHINITDFGITKGKTPVTEDKIDKIVRAITK